MEKPKYDVFLSHATPDKPVVEELAKLLKKSGFEPWLDKWNLIPGEPWQEAIEKALEDCAACAVCLGPSGTGPWQNEEMRAAIDRRVSDQSRQFRVIPVLLPRAERGEPSRLPAFLRATTWVEFRSTLDDEKALHRLIAGIRGLPPGADPGEAVAEGACPYRGLQVFDVGDALFFFGREALTEWLLDKLRRSLRQPLPRHRRPLGKRQVLPGPRRPRRRPEARRDPRQRRLARRDLQARRAAARKPRRRARAEQPDWAIPRRPSST